MKLKLNQVLAKTQHLSSTYRALLRGYIQFFKGSQGAFKGETKTYEAYDGTEDFPSKRGITLVQTTVSEKVDYLIEHSGEYIDSLFSQEKTNASGAAFAELVVDGESWGEYSSLELLRLKSLLEDRDFNALLLEVPTRSDAEQWEKCTAEVYEGREILQSPINEYINKTTLKEQYILPDPNVEKVGGNYQPQTATRSTVVSLGSATSQRYSGEATQRQRAMWLANKTNLLDAVINALERANEVEAAPSLLNAKSVFGYIFEK